jgi:predicted exporter
MALFLMFAVYLFVFALLCFLYGFKKALSIAAVPVLSVITAVSFISAFSMPITFFTVSGLILTLAIGIDYALFFACGQGSLPVISLGIFFSMLTTLLSFGVLSFSSFAPVSMFGLAAFLGIFGCFFYIYCLNKNLNRSFYEK